MKLKPFVRTQDPSNVYLSFYTDNQDLVTEFIPKETPKFSRFLADKYILLLRKLNIPICYWNIRHIIFPESRKSEDLRFIHHVIYEHDENNDIGRRERRAVNRIYSLYKHEYDNFVGSVLYAMDDKKAFDHPYAKAYVKRWKLNRLPEWKLLYHGVDYLEYLDLTIHYFDDELKRDDKREKRRQRRQRKLDKSSSKKRPPKK